MKKIILASNNLGKAKEFAELLAFCDVQLISQAQLKIPEVAETGLTFIENAIIKARHASLHSGLPALADDSGLEVDILQGEPGIYSARYAGEKANDKENMRKLILKLQPFMTQKIAARFRCVLALLRHPHDPAPIISEGVWEGEIIGKPRGENGFGYDPIFFIPELNCTAAELVAEEKNRLSHRAQALDKLTEKLTLL